MTAPLVLASLLAAGAAAPAPVRVDIAELPAIMAAVKAPGAQAVLVNVWATWCEPCREEMPTLDRLQARLGGDRFQVLALSVDQQGATIARKFYDEYAIKALPLYVDPTAKAAFVLDAPGLPVTLLVDRDGREIGRHLGAVKWDAPEVVERLRRAMTAE